MTKQEIVEFLRERPGYMKKGAVYLSKKLGVSADEILHAKNYIYSDRPHDSVENYNNENSLNQPAGKQDQTLEEYCLSVGLDPDKVDKYNHVKYWTDSAGNRRYTIVPKNENPANYAEEFRELVDAYSIQDTSHLFNKPDLSKERIAIINLFDAHIDKVSSVDRTDQDSSVETNVHSFKEAFTDLLESVFSMEPERIVIPVGNDFWHTNGSSNTTKNGTPLDDSVGLSNEESFRIGIELVMFCIDTAREIAPVTVVLVKGNHDHDKVMYLLECLTVAYKKQTDVDILDSRKSRQYIRYGQWLFGFTHGDQVKANILPSLMATDKDSRKHWSDVNRGIYFLGHIHHERRYDYRGCSVMYLRGVSSTDTWHWESGFTAVPKTAYAFIYDKDGKREYEFKVNI